MSKIKGARSAATDTDKAGEKSPSKLDTLIALLRRQEGASIAELAQSTGWQHHSVRGALAGSVKKKGHTVTSEAVEGARRYRIAETQA